MKSLIAAAALPLLLAACQAPLHPRGMAMPMEVTPAANAVPAPVPFVNAQIEDVDLDAGTVTLAHEAIPNLNMPPMTMVFAAKDKETLKGLKAGDRIRARFDTVRDQMMLIQVERSR
jgi:Cu/Ag efflux protein CusF